MLRVVLIIPQTGFSTLPRFTTRQDLLAKLCLMTTEVRRTTKTKEKIAIVQRYPELHDFLRFFNSLGPIYINRNSITTHRNKGLVTIIEEDLSCLLERLQNGLRGHCAIETVQNFIVANEDHRALLLDIFDRDLNIGMGKRMIQKALDLETIEVDGTAVSARHVTVTQSKGTKIFPITSKQLPVALGYPLQHPSIKLEATKDEYWLISRKLDGIRCLAHFDGVVIKLYTRAGNVLTHLYHISENLLHVAKKIHSANPEMTNFYIDGELCVLEDAGMMGGNVIKGRGPGGFMSEGEPSGSIDGTAIEGSGPGALMNGGKLGSDIAEGKGVEGIPKDGNSNDMPSFSTPDATTYQLADNFRAALSIVLSKPLEGKSKIDTSRLVFFAFDLISDTNPKDINTKETNGKDINPGENNSSHATMRETILSERLKILTAAAKGAQRVHVLEQHRTNDPLEFRNFVDIQRARGWEGLIVRRDCAFESERMLHHSTNAYRKDIIKVKDFFEAEFVVQDYKLERMLVASNGQHVMEDLVSSIKIDFGGVNVWVGSGFSLEERRSFAKDPTQLVGAQVTVRYFQESSSKKRDGLKSLRFPTIKAIYPGARNC